MPVSIVFVVVLLASQIYGVLAQDSSACWADDIVSFVSNKHPIVYDIYNTCLFTPTGVKTNCATGCLWWSCNSRPYDFPSTCQCCVLSASQKSQLMKADSSSASYQVEELQYQIVQTSKLQKQISSEEHELLVDGHRIEVLKQKLHQMSFRKAEKAEQAKTASAQSLELGLQISNLDHEISELDMKIRDRDSTISTCETIGAMLGLVLIIVCMTLIAWKAGLLCRPLQKHIGLAVAHMASLALKGLREPLLEAKDQEWADVVATVAAEKNREIERKDSEHKAEIGQLIAETGKERADALAAAAAEMNQLFSKKDIEHRAHLAITIEEKNKAVADAVAAVAAEIRRKDAEHEAAMANVIAEKDEERADAIAAVVARKNWEMEKRQSDHRAAMALAKDKEVADAICDATISAEKSEDLEKITRLLQECCHSTDMIKVLNGTFGNLGRDFDFLIFDGKTAAYFDRIVKIQCSGVSHRMINCEIVFNGCIVTIRREASAGVAAITWSKKFQFWPSDGLFEFQEDQMALDHGYLTLVFRASPFKLRNVRFPEHYNLSPTEYAFPDYDHSWQFPEVAPEAGSGGSFTLAPRDNDEQTPHSRGSSAAVTPRSREASAFEEARADYEVRLPDDLAYEPEQELEARRGAEGATGKTYIVESDYETPSPCRYAGPPPMPPLCR